MLNDAVTIVLYHALSSMATIGSEHLVLNDFLRASGAFFLVAIGGILIGIIGAAATGLTTRFGITVALIILYNTKTLDSQKN